MMIISSLQEKTRRRIRYVIVSLMIICMTPLCERGRMLKGAHTDNSLLGKELVCAIDLGDEMYNSNGLEAGFTYELLNRFAEDNHCKVTIKSSSKKDNYLDSLKNGDIDILISRTEDSDKNDLNILRSINENTVWAGYGMNDEDIMGFNNWISYMVSSDEIDDIKSRYYGSFNPHRKAERGIRSKTLSPYDNLIKEYASDLGWDWRMLAAVIYQESRFSINSTSFRGAMGLMQVMPQTGKYYGVSDLLNPEENIKAGTMHLKRLQRIFRKDSLDQDEMIKFTLAAYNAGEGRIIDCRNLAAAKDLDNNKWDEIVKVIPLMREDSILEESSVKLGKFQGYETIEYINNILSHYEAICKVCPK